MAFPCHHCTSGVDKKKFGHIFFYTHYPWTWYLDLPSPCILYSLLFLASLHDIPQILEIGKSCQIGNKQRWLRSPWKNSGLERKSLWLRIWELHAMVGLALWDTVEFPIGSPHSKKLPSPRRGSISLHHGYGGEVAREGTLHQRFPGRTLIPSVFSNLAFNQLCLLRPWQSLPISEFWGILCRLAIIIK